MSRLTDDNFDEETFECADVGAVDTFPKAAGDLARGDCVCIRGRPCKVLENEHIKNGKHGSAKAAIVGEDLFTGKHYELVAPGSFGLPCPFVSKCEYQLIDIEHDGALSLLDASNAERCDLDLPLKDNESLARAIRAHFDSGKSLVLITQKAMGIEAVIAFKHDTNGR